MSDAKADWDIANKRAARYAPPPTYEPLYAGVTGAAIVFGLLVLNEGLSHIDHYQIWPRGTVLIVIGFAIPFAYFWNKKRLHIAAVAKEFLSLTSQVHRGPGG